MPQEARHTSPSSSDPMGSRVSPEQPCVVERAGMPQRRLQEGSGARKRRRRLPQPKDWQQGLHPTLHLQPPTRARPPPQTHARRPLAPRAQRPPQPPDPDAGAQVSIAAAGPRRITASPLRPTVIAATSQNRTPGPDLPHTALWSSSSRRPATGMKSPCAAEQLAPA